MNTVYAKFSVGQIVRHKLFNYRGVIIDVDPEFRGTDDWYRKMAPSKPPKDKPWYKVLMHSTGNHTYVAERNLVGGATWRSRLAPGPRHLLHRPADGSYIPRQRGN